MGKGDAGLRVVAGSLRGRVLGPTPPGVRPTSDRVRESLFGRLGPLDGQRVLDLFAGTGALGIEALSRGAERLVAVDRSRRSVAAIQKNLEQLGVAAAAKVMREDARRAVRRLGDDGERFDLVLMDPPYAETDQALGVLEALVACDILDPAAVVVAEGSKRHSLSRVAGLILESTRAYGDTVVYWFGRESE